MITLVGATSAGGFVSSVTVDLPAGVEDGDRLLMLASANDFPTVTSRPAGWAIMTEDMIGTDVATYVWTRVADNEPSSYTVTWEGSHWHFLNLIVFRGVDRVRSYAVNSGDSISSVPLPVLDAETADVLVAYGFHWGETSKSWTPSGLTTITNLSRAIISAYQVQDGGPTPAYTLTAGTTGHMAATAILLTPSVTPGEQPRFPLRIRTELLLGDAWVDVSGDVRDTEPVVITRGRADEADTADTATCRLLLNNRHGRYSPRNPNSPYYGRLHRNTPIRVSVIAGEDRIPRFAGEVAEWPLRWDLSDHDAWIPITAAGPLRRLSQGVGHEYSALRRLLRASNPVAYWPLTDGGNATTGRPDVGAHPIIAHDVLGPAPSAVLKRERVDWGEGDLAPWLEPVARTRTGRGRLTGPVDWAEDAQTAWSADLVRARSGGEDRFGIISHQGPDGAGVEWRLRFDYAVPDIRLFVRTFMGAPSGTFAELDAWARPQFFDDDPHHVRLSVTADGGDSVWEVYIDGTLVGSGTASSVPVRPPQYVEYRWLYPSTLPDDAEHASVGHITVWASADELVVPSPTDVLRALDGFAGERAGVRIERICREEGIALQVVGDLEATPPMGPQYVATPLEVMRDAEEVDRGMLTEARDEVALLYRTHRSRYNQELSG